MGYYSLAAGSVARRDVPGKIQRNIVDPIPSIVLGRLAVHRAIRRQGVGEGLLQHALLRIREASEIVGARLILVHAVDGEAAAFYLKYGFEEFPPKSNILFLKVETLEDAR
jgi:GNAT superfamily N-acetyltransferase